MKNKFEGRRRLTLQERDFVLRMAQCGDATKSARAIYPNLSDQSARIIANGLMRRRDIFEHVEFLKNKFQEIENYVKQI